MTKLPVAKNQDSGRVHGRTMKRTTSQSTTIFLWVVGNWEAPVRSGFQYCDYSSTKKTSSKHIARDEQGWLVQSRQVKVCRILAFCRCLSVSLTLRAQHIIKVCVGFPVSVPRIPSPSSPPDKTSAVARPGGKKWCGLDTEMGRNSYSITS